MAASVSIDEYKVGVICALPLERTAVDSMFDNYHDLLPTASGDVNTYSFGSIGKHNVVLASLCERGRDMRRSFPGVKFGLMVGIAGGPLRPTTKHHDLRLGDVVVGCVNGVPSVINYRLGKETSMGFDIRSELAEPPEAIQRAVSALKTQHQREGPTYLKRLDAMFRKNPRLNRPQISVDYYNQPQVPDYLLEADFVHPQDAAGCEGYRESVDHVVARGPRFLRDPPADVGTAKFIKRREDSFTDYPNVHYGTVASADTLMKDATERDAVYQRVKRQRKADVLCFEMEAVGIVKGRQCLVVRGICDYSDSHKNDAWQNFAPATAAAYAKDLLLRIPPEMVSKSPRANDVIDEG
ncbi:hypothetical protein LTR56_027710 [Elasticomyces elasticus]|nr:hypothetical protein LTR56_027710 [Elasticomyces elasticus]KAK3614397.1 hypothetical protein LTR22_027798 [Elasticomyces elasticus]KAK4899878.1 hypothetical protein LTR49_027555 [Elasticomyces elasticus]